MDTKQFNNLCLEKLEKLERLHSQFIRVLVVRSNQRSANFRNSRKISPGMAIIHRYCRKISPWNVLPKCTFSVVKILICVKLEDGIEEVTLLATILNLKNKTVK
uniref:Uncharacterized protein n=1 Tax=Meloidogyne incognita TaxID=6306 RepID=A0A914LEQ1_MELIC